jgi:hypothetical protein
MVDRGLCGSDRHEAIVLVLIIIALIPCVMRSPAGPCSRWCHAGAKMVALWGGPRF